MLEAIVRLFMTAAHRVRSRLRPLMGPTSGVHGVVLTSSGEVVLVRLTYARGWYLPGGGLKRRENAKDGLLRELREEIGLRAWSSIETLGAGTHLVTGRPEHNTLFVVRGASFRPRWSLEIAEVRAFACDALPPDLAPWSKAALEQVAC